MLDKNTTETVNNNHPITLKLPREARTSLHTISQIKRERNEEKLADYMNIGRALSEAKKMFASTQKFGAFIRSEWPEMLILNPSLRTDTKWLFEALYVPGSKGGDILKVLGIAEMVDYYTANPSVIRDDYRTQQKKMGIFVSKSRKASIASPKCKDAVANEPSVSDRSSKSLPAGMPTESPI